MLHNTQAQELTPEYAATPGKDLTTADSFSPINTESKTYKHPFCPQAGWYERMVTDFSPQERRLLSSFVSNVDSDVFVLMNLPEVIKGALFSRYSRTSKSLKRLLLDEFINAPEGDFSKIVGRTVSVIWISKTLSTWASVPSKAICWGKRHP